jgi:predicted nucleotidyltransferase
MHQAVDRVVSVFLSEVDAALGAEYAAVLFGSAARGDFVVERSDINLMLVIEDLSPAVLRSLGPAFAGWRATDYPAPLLITSSEWRRSADVFPIEIADMLVSRQVLRGRDPVADATIRRSDLRRELEREFRGKLLRLRQGYAAVGREPATLAKLAGKSASSVLVLLRALLELLGRPVPTDPAEVAAAAAGAIGIPQEHLLPVVRLRGRADAECSPDVFEEYLGAVTRAAGFLDQLQLGEPE